MILRFVQGPALPSTGLIKGVKLLSSLVPIGAAIPAAPCYSALRHRLFYPKRTDEDLKDGRGSGQARPPQDCHPTGSFPYLPGNLWRRLIFYHPMRYAQEKTHEDYVRESHLKNGYSLVYTPNILKENLWEVSGHAQNYKENMYYF